MDKPISVVIEDTKQELVKVINESNIHPCIMEMMIKSLYDEVKSVASMQLKKDLKEYNDSLDTESE